MKFTKPVCSTCGSDNVKVAASATFNPTTQEFELATTFDDGSVCGKCGGPASLNDVPLAGNELHQARAHALALEDGWLPSDEDCDGYGLDYTKPTEEEIETDATHR